MGAGNHTRVLCNPALNGQVISSVPILSNLRFFPFLTMKSEATRVVSKLWRGPAHSFSFSSHFLLILTSPARSVSLEERLSAFETEQSFLFLGDLHILFLAPGGKRASLRREFSESHILSRVSWKFTRHSAVHTVYSVKMAPVTRTFHVTGILSQSLTTGVFRVVPTFQSYYPSTRLSPSFFPPRACWCLTLGSSPYVHKVAARDLGHHCTQMRKQGKLFISCLSSLAETRSLH